MQAVKDQIAETSLPRRLIVECIRRWGGGASDALLDPACSLFSCPDIDGVIGYRRGNGHAIVYGDPVCKWADVPLLVEAFHSSCREQNIKIIYIMASEPFARWTAERLSSVLVAFGEELIFDPHDDPKKREGTHGSLVRRKVRRASGEGVAIQEYHPYESSLQQALEQVACSWLQGRSGPQIHISSVNLFADSEGKRWFYAHKGNDIVGMLVLNRLESRQGWLLNHLMAAKNAPNGTTELLVTGTLEVLAHEDCHYVTAGVVPCRQLGEISGLGALSIRLVRGMFAIANKVFPLEGPRIFWSKFHPSAHPSYLVFHQTTIGWRQIRALTQALHVRWAFNATSSKE